jgi:Rha family phage regulatory protein
MKNEITIKSGVQELGIFEKSAEAWVSSRTVADTFDKNHSHVLRDIQSKIIPYVSESFTESNFGLSDYKDKSGKKNKEYLLNRKSFAIVAMGFTGEKAMKFKEKYIEAFESMLSLISTRILSKQNYKIMTDAIKQNIGDDPSIFAKEANMVNLIVLGMTAKDFKSVNKIDETESTRDHVVSEKLENLDRAQLLNSELIRAGLDYESRQGIIKNNYSK